MNSNLGRRGFYNPEKILGLDEGEYVAERLAELAAQYFEDNKDTPSLLCMSHFSVHAPIHDRPDLVEKYEKKLPPQSISFTDTSCGYGTGSVSSGASLSILESIDVMIGHSSSCIRKVIIVVSFIESAD